jgi:type IV pilus assembly protein PilC
MPSFVWKGRNLAGQTQSGVLTVDSREDVLAFLRKSRIIATSVREKQQDVKFKLPMRKGVGSREMAVFTRQFATMIDSGLPLVQCLEILSKQATNEFFRKTIEEVTSDVEAGSTLNEALARHPAVFDGLFVHMVNAGEAGGILDTILARLATYIEKSDSLRRKVKSALTYPAVVLTVAVGVTVFMLTAIIPTFARLFADFGAELPLPTKIVLAMSNSLRATWWMMILGAVGAVIGLKRYYKTDAGRHQIDRLMLRIPVLGDVLKKASVARFTRTLGTLVSSGVPILKGLEITAETAGNVILSDAIKETRNSIGQGETIAGPLAKCDVFPPMVVQMIAVGEETGALDAMLGKIADFYDDEVDTAVATLTSVIEPVLIVIMGVIVGGMVVAMYMPMFEMVKAIAG